MVESVNVRVLAYVPVRRPSLARIVCLKATVTGSLETGFVQLASVVGAAEPPTAANAPAGPAAGLDASRLQRLVERERPVDQWPVAVLDGSETDRVASPAVETTLAVCAAS